MNKLKKTLDCDKSKISVFRKYLTKNPIYFTDLAGLPHTKENIEKTVIEYINLGLISEKGLQLTVKQLEELGIIKGGDR